MVKLWIDTMVDGLENEYLRHRQGRDSLLKPSPSYGQWRSVLDDPLWIESQNNINRFKAEKQEARQRMIENALKQQEKLQAQIEWAISQRPKPLVYVKEPDLLSPDWYKQLK